MSNVFHSVYEGGKVYICWCHLHQDYLIRSLVLLQSEVDIPFAPTTGAETAPESSPENVAPQETPADEAGASLAATPDATASTAAEQVPGAIRSLSLLNHFGCIQHLQCLETVSTFSMLSATSSIFPT